MRVTMTATVAASAQLSDAVDLADLMSVSLLFPAAMTGANVGLWGSQDGTNFYELYDGGAPATIPVNVAKLEPIPPEWLDCRYLKFKSDAAEAAARTLTVYGR